jgi:membrane fusion protein, multidrug efflux system
MRIQFWRASPVFAALTLLALTGCRGNTTAQTTDKAAPAGPQTVEVVKVVEQPLNVTLSLPGELTPYQTVALYSRVTGFVKAITVDRGSRVREGQQLAALEAPELVAQKSEAQSKLQGAEAQLAAIRAKADGSAGTYERLKAASATPGVVAGNDVVLAQKAVEADQSQIAAAVQNVEAARQALKSVSDMEGYLRITAPFSGVVTERNVHPGALVGPTGGPGTATPLSESSKAIDCASSFQCPRRTRPA